MFRQSLMMEIISESSSVSDILEQCYKTSKDDKHY